MAGSRLSSASRLTPLRTATRIRATLPRDQRVERRPYVRLRRLDAEGRPAGRLQQDEPRDAAHDLLVAGERRPGGVAVDPDRLRTQRLLDRRRVEAGEPQRRQETEADGAPVWELEPRGRLERVREGVA